MKFLQSRTGAVVAGAATLAVLGGTGAAVADGHITGRDIKDGSISSRDVDQLFSRDISNQSLNSWDLSDNSVGFRELKDDVESSFAKADHSHDGRYYTKEESDARYAQKGDLPEPARTVELKREDSDGLVPIANIGGRFADRRTEVDSFDLQPGTYQLTSDGFFTSTEATSGQTRLQLALRTSDKELGTCFTGTASKLAGREITCSTARVVTLDQPTTVKVYAFGYADDQGSADSGKFAVASVVNLLKVG